MSVPHPLDCGSLGAGMGWLTSARGSLDVEQRGRVRSAWEVAPEPREGVWGPFYICEGLPWAQTVKCLLTMQESRLQSLGREDPLEKEMATHSNTLAWKIPRTEEPGRLQSMGLQRMDTSERLHL